MANIKSQIKRNRQNEKRRQSHAAVRSELRTRVRTAVAAVEAGAEDAELKVRQAVKSLDVAVSKGAIHRNQAARRKSRLLARVNTASG